MTILTKAITPMRRKGLVRRQRLLDFLYRSLDYKLTVVAAAAGYGKTSMLVDFAHDAEFPVCWLTLDESDGDGGQFLLDLAVSVAQHFPDFGERTRSALQSGMPPAEAVGVLINELVTQVTDFAILVLDDYHLADTAGVGQLVGTLLRFLPGHLRLILSGRALPGLDLVMLTARQEVAALVPGELCFTADETVTLLAQNHRLTISVEDAEVLVRQVGGWITGVVLATQQMPRRLAPQLRPVEGRLDAIYEYLAREVLALQPPHLRDFMVQTSVLRWMTPAFCDELLRRSDAADVLSLLEAHHLFIERVESDDVVQYRYHPLFQEFLLEQLVTWGRDRLDAVHRRAAALYAQTSDAEEAIRHWLAVDALDEARPLMDALAPSLFVAGQHNTLLEWHGRLEASGGSAPRLALQVAKVLTEQCDYGNALDLLNRTLENPASVSILPHVRIQQAHVSYRMGETQEAIALLEPFLDGGGGSLVEANACRILGLCRLGQGKPSEAQARLRQALAIYERLDDRYNQSQVLLGLVAAESMLGQSQAALAAIDRALELLRDRGHPAALAETLNNAACLYHYAGEFERAEKLYREALSVVQQGGNRRVEALVLLGWGDLLRDTNRVQDALAVYQQALGLVSGEADPWLLNYARVGLATSCRLVGDLTQAIGWIDQAAAGQDEGLRATILVEEGAIWLARGELESGLGVLLKARDILHGLLAWPDLAVAELRIADGHLLSGDEGRAILALERALAAISRCAAGEARPALEARHHPGLLALGRRRLATPPVLSHLQDQVADLDQASLRLAQHARDRESARLLQVFGFGTGRVIREGQEVPAAGWKRQHARWLFFFVIDRPRAQRRDLLRRLWPDVPESKAMGRLHAALYSARLAVGAERLAYLPDEESYTIDHDSGIWYDVAEFEGLLKRASRLSPGRARADLLNRAVELYAGPYLADADERWAEERRAALGLAHLEALIDLGDCYAADQDYASARMWYRQVLEVDPYREDVYRRLMRMLAHEGRRAEAVREYERCAELLRRELGLKPDPQTRALLDEILQS